MDINNLQFKAAVRTGWQALDLGFLMARRWYPSLLMLTALPATLVFIPLIILLPGSPYWVLFIIWWLKPFWERMPLYFASRQVFEEHVDSTSILRKSLLIYRTDWLPWLLWRRLSFYRAFDAPVTCLEELKGKTRKQRLKILHGKHADVAMANQFVGCCCEVIIAIGLYITLLFFLPDSLSVKIQDSYGQTLAGEWMYCLFGFAAMLLVAPFHSMAGFALYLNRRIELEAWDIEITFRNLAERVTGRQALISCLSGSLIALAISFTSDNAIADQLNSVHDKQSSKALIEKVLSGDDYGQEKTVEKWRFKHNSNEGEETIPNWFIALIEWLESLGWGSNDESAATSDNFFTSLAFWLKIALIGLFVYLLIYLYYRFRTPLSRWRKSSDTIPPEVMFGLDVRPESLPNNVPNRVLELWQAQQHRDALGLLYRASLSRLIEHHAIAFKSSHTEIECVKLVEASHLKTLSQYFSNLTQVWRQLAYGHHLPASTTLQSLCDDWPGLLEPAE